MKGGLYNGCAQMSDPDTREQSDVGVQQSADDVHDAPSSEHATAQARACPCPPQLPVQHSAVKAHAPPSATHDVADACAPQRFTPLVSPAHPGMPAQQLDPTEQKSPTEPHDARS
jgi:hypothetical protein